MSVGSLAVRKKDVYRYGRGGIGITEGRFSTIKTQINRHLVPFLGEKTKLQDIDGNQFRNSNTSGENDGTQTSPMSPSSMNVQPSDRCFVLHSISSGYDRTNSLDGRTLSAPDLIIPEVCSALWKKLRAGHMTRPQAMDGLPDFFDNLVPCRGSVPDPWPLPRNSTIRFTIVSIWRLPNSTM
jgi:hypothetical protein